MLVVVPDDWRLSPRIPRPTPRRDQHEPTLIEEGDVGPKSSSFFLLRATCAAASARWRPRRAESLGALAPDSSTHTRAGRATDGSGGTVSQTPDESPSPSAATSTARWETSRPSRQRGGASEASRAVWRSASWADPAWAWQRAPCRRASSNRESSGAQLQVMLGPVGQSLESLPSSLTTPQHDAGAAPSSLLIRWVSCPIVLHRSISYTNINNQDYISKILNGIR